MEEGSVREGVTMATDGTPWLPKSKMGKEAHRTQAEFSSSESIMTKHVCVFREKSHHQQTSRVMLTNWVMLSMGEE